MKDNVYHNFRSELNRHRQMKADEIRTWKNRMILITICKAVIACLIVGAILTVIN
jgi:hypothetical protein